MSPRQDPPDVESLARSMLLVHGAHDDDDAPAEQSGPVKGSWSKAPDFATDPERNAAVAEATRRDRERYLHSGLVPVDCRFCHATIVAKKLGPTHTAVQWNSAAVQRCAFFAELRAEGEDSTRARSCPKLTDSIKHAVAEGCLEEASIDAEPADG